MADLDRLLRSDISYAATDAVQAPDFTAIERQGTRRRRTRTALVAGTAVAALLVVAGTSPQLFENRDNDRITPIKQPEPIPLPVAGEGVLEPTTYLVPHDESAAFDYTITFPRGWFVQDRNDFYMDEDKPTGASFLPFQVDGIYADACRGQSGSVTVVGPRAQDLVTALLAQQGPVKSQPVTMTLGGYPATRIDLCSPPRLDTRSCFLGRGVGAQIWQNPEGRYLVLMPDGLLSVYVVDVRGKRQVFTTQYDPTGISATDLAALVQMMASIRIKP